MESKRKKKSGKQNVLSQIEAVALAAKKSKFSEEFLVKISHEAESIAVMLDCSQIQSVLFSLIFNLNFTKPSVDIECLSGYMECSPIMIARHINDLEGLCKKKILRCENNQSQKRRRRENTLDRLSYYVNRQVLDALLNEQKYNPDSEVAFDTYDLIAKIILSMADHEKGLLTWDEMEVEIQTILEENNRLPFVRELKRFKLDFNDQLILFWVCDEFLDGREASDFIDAIKSIFHDFRRQLEIRKEFLDGTNGLIKKDLVSLEEGLFQSDRNIILKERTLDILLGNDKKAFTRQKEKKSPDVIIANDIKVKQLYYNHDEGHQISFLTNALTPGNYEKLVTRLKKSGMNPGFTILFHGAPGVGKTESVLQIARQTGRDIKMVNISETKNLYYGESEKKVKAIFDQYRRQVETSKIVPILLFNEADGIFGTRKPAGHSSIDNTENSIQAIILSEMETLEGILIATTNLVQNFDKAFERRFLYKIRFEKPSVFNKVKIWKDRIKGLSLVELKKLAEKHDFSGGQIDNVSRKLITHNTLYGSTDMFMLEQFCEEETIEGQRYTKIGFVK